MQESMSLILKAIDIVRTVWLFMACGKVFVLVLLGLMVR